MKLDKWSLRQRIEKDYANAIKKLTDRLLHKMGTETDPTAFKQKIRAMARSPTFTEAAEKAALAMLTQLAEDNARTWREAARHSSKGRILYDAIQNELHKKLDRQYWEIISRNADYIKSLPDELAEIASRRAAENALSGRRASDIIPEIMEMYPGLAKSHARLIARTETSKAQSALTRTRAESIGINWYEWKTSEDSRVRSSHRHMDGVLIRFDNPPAPETLIGMKSQGHYNAGDIYNCRCYAAPLTEIDDVSWPHKVYYGGRIVKMARVQFQKIE